MKQTMWLPIVVGCALAGGMVGATETAADGLPVVNIDAGRSGVALPGSHERFVAVPAGEDTLVARTSQEDGSVLEAVEIRGELTIPAVAYDGTAAGLSSDGSTLTLIRPRATFPQRTTSLAVLDARKLRARQRIDLDGDFSFDALSPDGKMLYLIEYEDPRNPADYAVRAYDLDRNRLLPQPIVDPAEPDEDMAGYPLARATSPDGRWAYTLYDGFRHEPFVHALDTQRGTAACIDLPQLKGSNGLELEVGPSGGMTVLVKEEPTLAIDPQGFEVSEIEAPAAAPTEDGGGFPFALVALATAAGLVLLALSRLRHRRDGAVSDEELAALVEVETPSEEGEDALTR